MKIFFALVITALSFGVQATESFVPQEKPDVDVFDLKSVQRGAAYFVDYCMGCHSLKHVRYSRLAKDLKMTEEELRKDVMAEGAKIHDSLLTAMDPEDSAQWFGLVPPDLTLVARARGANWLYSYLKGFYVDPKSKTTGVNNAFFKDVAMPNVLWKMQGLQKPVYGKRDGAEVIEKLENTGGGTMSSEEFDEMLLDLTNFLVYAAEPAQFDRLRLGKYVIFVLLVLTVILYKLKKEYWKDIE